MRRTAVGIVTTLAFFVVAVTVAGQSPEPWLGAWKANVAKSTYSPGPPPTYRSNITTWESLGGGQFKNTTDIVDEKGQSTHTETIIRFGVELPVTGAAVPTTRTYGRIDGRGYEYVQKVNGKVTTTTRTVVAPDGKTGIVTVTGTNAQGQTVKNVVLYEQQ